MNTSRPPILPPLLSEQSRPIPSSPPQINRSKLLKPFIVILLIGALIQPCKADGNCYSIISSISSSSCQICPNSQGKACLFTNTNGTGAYLNPTDCVKKCCNHNLFDNLNQYSLCNNQETNYESSNGSNTLSLATILIIIFFSIPAGICLLIAICSCVNTRRRTDEAGDEPYLSAINLNDFNLEDLGPLYQDRTQSCSICLESDCNLRTKCGHSYHSQCLGAWIHKKEKCPLCVTRDFNPIILYCVQCFKQVKMVQLMDRMPAEEGQDWSKYSEWKCEQCLNDRLDDVISLEFSMPEEKGKQGMAEQGDRSLSKAKVAEDL